MMDHILFIILFAPFVGTVILIFISNDRPLLVRYTAAAFSFVSLIFSFILLYAYDYSKGGFQFLEQYEWANPLGISFFLGVDGIGVAMVLASSILLFAGVFVSWHVKDRAKEFYIFLLILAAATIGVYVLSLIHI